MKNWFTSLSTEFQFLFIAMCLVFALVSVVLIHSWYAAEVEVEVKKVAEANAHEEFMGCLKNGPTVQCSR
jgi:hypothetical protein